MYADNVSRRSDMGDTMFDKRLYFYILRQNVSSHIRKYKILNMYVYIQLHQEEDYCFSKKSNQHSAYFTKYLTECCNRRRVLLKPLMNIKLYWVRKDSLIEEFWYRLLKLILKIIATAAIGWK